MTKQKNGVKSQCIHQIHQECTGTIYSPRKSLAIILSSHPFYTTLQTVTSQHLNSTLKLGAAEISLYKLGYEEGGTSSHSLQASGATAMHPSGIDPNTIKKKMGPWKSYTFPMNIHEQINALATGISITMSNSIPLRHVAELATPVTV